MKTLAGPPPDFKGTWGYAEGICFDKKKRELYVVYTDADTIRVFDTDGNLKRSFSVGKPDPKVAPRTDWNPTPTIGIGASSACDGQILVTHDMLGVFDWTPKFVKRYAGLRTAIADAVAQYAIEVRRRSFPEPAQVLSPRRARQARKDKGLTAARRVAPPLNAGRSCACRNEAAFRR